jgi:hypothetical protein
VSGFVSQFVPPVLPAPRGVFDVVTWIQNGTLPLRFLAGMTVRQSNIGLSDPGAQQRLMNVAMQYACPVQ